MKESKLFVPRQLTAGQWFWFLAVIGLLVRLPMLRQAAAETTDGVLCLTYFSPDMADTPRMVLLPGYPALLWIGLHLGLPDWFWGRLLSTVAGLIFLIPLWKLSRRWLPMEMSGIVCLMALFSPLLWQWSLKIMPDTLFLLLFWWCLERMVTVYIDKSVPAWWQASVLGVLTACVRVEGFLLLPWLIVQGEQVSSNNRWSRRIALVLGWATPFFFVKNKILTLLFAYREGMGWTEGVEKVRLPFLNFVDHLYAYLSQPLYVFTPLVFWFAILGMAKMVRVNEPKGEAFRKIILQVYTILFLSRLIPTTYQDRHMLPFLPLLLVAAGFHLEHFFESLDKNTGFIKKMFWRNGILSLCLVWLALFTAAALIAQEDSFGDIKRSSEFLKTIPAEAVIYSDEVPKTRYWSGRKITLMPYLAENTQFVPKPDDYIVLHSFYVPRIGYAERHLMEKYRAELLHDEQSMVVPLLTDIMEEPSLQNRTASTAFRFTPQFFKSRVYHIPRQTRKENP